MAVSVIAATILNVSPDFAQCADGAPTVLVASAPGGTWTGNGISGPPWEFDPAAAGSGSHPLTYTYVSPNGCVSTAQTNATVYALPIINAGPDVQLCNQPIPYQITGATPAGGTWSAGS
ncbi:MAG TPA: hypothetical protein PK593_06335, partial [Thermomicrobiales bacterium]|nr:hypothetical protein [Thermomicrobiales bacterium]